MTKNAPQKRKGTLPTKRVVLIAALSLVAVAIIIGASFYFYANSLRKQVNKEVTIEAGTPIVLESFFTSDATNTKFVTDISSIDTNIPQTYKLKVQTGKSFINVTEEVILNIVDTTPPTGEAIPQEIYWDKIPTAIDVVGNIHDLSSVSAEYLNPMGQELEPGTRDIPVKLIDAYGNETIIDVPFTIIYDPEAPVISGTKDIEAFIGDTILYRDGVTVKDNLDSNPVLDIDTSEVKAKVEGVYPVTYIATDGHGNSSSVTIMLSLRVKPDRYYDPEEIYALAREVIERNNICNENMSDAQITLRIFDWVSSHMWYIRDTERCDWTAGAYDGLTTYSGDCYTYMAVAHAMLGSMGIESICLERYPAEPTPHFWNLVKIDGKWYHCDACLAPDMNTKYNFICLFSANEIKWWNYNFDESALPDEVVIGTESIQYQLDYTGVELKDPPEEEAEEEELLEETPDIENPIETEEDITEETEETEEEVN
ncbi:MAG: hypothetical protein MJ093_08885 [Saccharofermentans sp.]|nr:hypothetical protein [Saccharofermentans sp.]